MAVSGPSCHLQHDHPVCQRTSHTGTPTSSFPQACEAEGYTDGWTCWGTLGGQHCCLRTWFLCDCWRARWHSLEGQGNRHPVEVNFGQRETEANQVSSLPPLDCLELQSPHTASEDVHRQQSAMLEATQWPALPYICFSPCLSHSLSPYSCFPGIEFPIKCYHLNFVLYFVKEDPRVSCSGDSEGSGVVRKQGVI